jgi:hypothetical protein
MASVYTLTVQRNQITPDGCKCRRRAAYVQRACSRARSATLASNVKDFLEKQSNQCADDSIGAGAAAARAGPACRLCARASSYADFRFCTYRLRRKYC